MFSAFSFRKVPARGHLLTALLFRRGVIFGTPWCLPINRQWLRTNEIGIAPYSWKYFSPCYIIRAGNIVRVQRSTTFFPPTVGIYMVPLALKRLLSGLATVQYHRIDSIESLLWETRSRNVPASGAESVLNLMRKRSKWALFPMLKVVLKGTNFRFWSQNLLPRLVFLQSF